MDFFGINSAELLILLVVAALVIGPERLPGYAEQLGRWVRQARRFVQDARGRIDSELGDTPVDWAALDPRQYDPRQIVRQALLDDDPPQRPATAGRPTSARSPGGPGTDPRGPSASSGAPGESSGGTEQRVSSGTMSAPFDDEAT